jgi:hypothetical protein
MEKTAPMQQTISEYKNYNHFSRGPKKSTKDLA